MRSRFLVVVGLCVTSSILHATVRGISPHRRLGSDNDYGHPHKHNHQHDKDPSYYRRRLEDAKATDSSYYDGHGKSDKCDHDKDEYSHDDYKHEGYGYSYMSFGGDCDDYGKGHYGKE